MPHIIVAKMLGLTLPLTANKGSKIQVVWVEDANGKNLFEIDPEIDIETAWSLAEFIVRRVNEFGKV